MPLEVPDFRHHAEPDNLIIGGGPAGSMLAIRLAAAGRKVTLLEKEKSAHHSVCGEFLSPEALAYLGQAGIDPLRLGAATIRFLRLSSRRKVVEAALPFTALSLSRYALDEALLSRAAESGCNVHLGVFVDGLTAQDGLWFVEARNGDKFCAQTVFLANGKHDLRGWDRRHKGQSDLVAFKMHWQLQASQTTALRAYIDMFLFPGGYGAISLVERDVANLCLVVRRARLRRIGGWPQLFAGILKDDTHLQQRMQGATPLWNRPLALSSIPYGYLASQPGGLWCIGDQAAVIPSFTGDGMSIALHSASLAAEMVLAGKSPDDYHRKLHSQLSRGMGLASVLSRTMVTGLGRNLATFELSLFPNAMRWIASSTRIPRQALLAVPGPGL